MLFNQKIGLIEPTKLLERYTVDTMTFTNSIVHDYLSTAKNIDPDVENGPRPGGGDDNPYEIGIFRPWTGAYQTPMGFNGELNIRAMCFFNRQDQGDVELDPVGTTIRVISPNGASTISTNNTSNTNAVLATIALDVVGHWQVVYTYNNVTAKVPTATYDIYVVNNIAAKPDYTITDVINRVLKYGLGNWNGYFKLDPAVAEKFQNVKAPEFHFTRNTLREVLQTIGGYKDVQALPRLKWSEEDKAFTVITFDFLGGKTTWTPPGATEANPLGKFTNYHKEQTLNDWCGGFDTYAENLIDRSPNGTVSQLYPRTVRTESGDLVINDNYAIITTEKPIYSVQKLEMWYMNSNGEKVGDITPYVFEKSEYDNLTKYQGDFPFAKQYAMYYTQGQNNLYGLTLKPETANILGLGDAIEQYAAVAVAQRASGQTYGKGGIANFAYSITYTPIQGARLKQYRVYRDRPTSNLLYYNQSANTIEAENYGGNLKATLARTGNQIEVVTYRLFSLSNLPKVGMLLDGKYISKADYELERYWIRVTLWLTKDFNRLNQYLAIDSRQRFYEVSEKQSVLRQCNFSYSYGLDGLAGNNITLTPSAKSKILSVINDNAGAVAQDSGTRAGFAILQPLTEEYEPIGSKILLPVNVIACGNSVAFTITFADNYAAGYQAQYLGSAKKILRAVPYGDEYGEFAYLDIEIYPAGATWYKDNAAYPFSYADQTSNDGAIGFCDLLPQLSGDILPDPDDAILSERLPIGKDGREQIEVTIQMHFTAENTDMIVGAAYASELGIVSTQPHAKRLVMLPYRLSVLEERLYDDLTAYVATYPTFELALGSRIMSAYPVNTTSAAAQSWAIVDEDGRILFGRNEELAAGATGQEIRLALNDKAI